MNNSSLGSKLVSLALVSTAVPLLVLIALFYRESVKSSKMASEAILSAASSDLSNTAANLYAEAELARSLLEQSTAKVAAYADKLMKERGGLLPDEAAKVRWDAVDQYSGQTTSVELPRMLLGGEWLGQVSDVGRRVPIVDDIREVSGEACTIFQRINERGDMLRVATSVVGRDGKRAVGTFIPAVHPDGSRDRVLSEVLAGRKYLGRANVVGEWYQTSYSPLTDASGRVIGMSYVGAPERTANEELRKRIHGMKVGKDGYVFVINTKGADKGRYEISLEGKRDGENVLAAKGADGREVIREMIELVEKAKAGEVVSYRYDWKNGNEPLRTKIALLSYFAPWDWMIGVSTYEDEFLASVREMDRAAANSMIRSVVVAGVFALGACLAVAIVIRRVVRKVEALSTELRTGAHETGNAASDVSRSSEELASGANEQASAIEETTATINELTAQTHANSESANTARDLIHETGSLVDEADTKMHALNVSMKEIARVSLETQKIVKTIDEIAFQTNILALNAAVEAARAGEAGAGFAVVANEVRSLAQRAAEAARNTNQLIGDSTSRISSGCDMADKVKDAFGLVREKTTRVTELISQIAEASADQQTGHDQIERAIDEMNSVVQRNAAAAEESAAASEELFAQSEQLLASVNELNHIIMGSKAHIDMSTIDRTGSKVRPAAGSQRGAKPANMPASKKTPPQMFITR